MDVPVEILLVEDYEPDVQLLFMMLKRHRITNKVHVVSDGLMALDFLFCRNVFAHRISEPLPTAVLLDIRIPRVDGLEVLRQVKGNPATSHVPVIMTTGSIYPEELERCKRLGATDCIQKPVGFEDLRAISDRLGFSWSLSSLNLMEESPSYSTFR